MSSEIQDSWFCAEGQQDQLPVIIRGRQRLQEIISPDSHPHMLRIVWEFETDEPSGLPSRKLTKSMGQFEDAVVDALEEDALCVFFCVYLHAGRKEWLAYTSDVQATCDRFNAALTGHEPYPVELSVDEDPQWSEYWDVLSGAGMLEDGQS